MIKYKIRFDDGTSESNVLPENIQFIVRSNKVNDSSMTTVVIDSDTKDNGDAVTLLDTLGEIDVVEDVEANTRNMEILN